MIPESGTLVSLSTGGWIAHFAHFERRSLLQFLHTRSKKQGFLPPALQRAGWCAVMCAGEQGSSVLLIVSLLIKWPTQLFVYCDCLSFSFFVFCFAFLALLTLIISLSQKGNCMWKCKTECQVFVTAHKRPYKHKGNNIEILYYIFFPLLLSGNVWYSFPCKLLIPWRELMFNLPVFVFRFSLVIKCSHKFLGNPWEEILVVIHL